MAVASYHIFRLDIHLLVNLVSEPEAAFQLSFPNMQLCRIVVHLAYLHVNPWNPENFPTF